MPLTHRPLPLEITMLAMASESETRPDMRQSVNVDRYPAWVLQIALQAAGPASQMAGVAYVGPIGARTMNLDLEPRRSAAKSPRYRGWLALESWHFVLGGFASTASPRTGWRASHRGRPALHLGLLRLEGSARDCPGSQSGRIPPGVP